MIIGGYVQNVIGISTKIPIWKKYGFNVKINIEEKTVYCRKDQRVNRLFRIKPAVENTWKERLYFGYYNWREESWEDDVFLTNRFPDM